MLKSQLDDHSRLLDVIAPTSNPAFLLCGVWRRRRHWLCTMRFCAKEYKKNGDQEFHCTPWWPNA